MKSKNIFYLTMLLAMVGLVGACEKVEDEHMVPFTAEGIGEIIHDDQPVYSEGIPIEGSDTVFNVNGVTFKMIRVEGGTFMMGSNDVDKDLSSAQPVHEVTLSTYYIGETEVTVALYNAVMGRYPGEYRKPWTSTWNEKTLPVEGLFYETATEFAEQLKALTGFNFSLPTEAQWEYAARGGNRSHGYIYSGSNTVGDVANVHQYAGGTRIEDGYPSPVAQKSPNELGIYDMTGNVYEFCYGWYGPYSAKAQTDPLGPAYPDQYQNRILRGGAYCSPRDGHRIAARYHSSRLYSGKRCTGMRLAIR